LIIQRWSRNWKERMYENDNKRVIYDKLYLSLRFY
jgi:hypothetical protein